MLLVGLLAAARAAQAQPPPPYPNPPPYPAYPDPGPVPIVPPWSRGGEVVCRATGEQRDLEGTDDYAHGAYFAWNDHRGADFDVYATHLGPDGQPAPGWA